MRKVPPLIDRFDYMEVHANVDELGIPYISMYPLKSFRGPKEIINKLLFEKNGELLKKFPETSVEQLQYELNLQVNQTLRTLHEDGVLIVDPPPPPEIVLWDSDQRQNSLSYSHDGYALFNPGELPPYHTQATH